MNREIKFRAWDTKEMRLSPSSFSLGDLGSWFEAHSGKYGFNKDGDSIIMQYTGLKDKKRTAEFPNGQEIYEGDIVKLTTEEDCWNSVVVYQYGGFDIQWPSDMYETGCDEFQANMAELMGEVIGNIYENPELLQ